MSIADTEVPPIRLRSEVFIGLGDPAANQAAILVPGAQTHVLLQFSSLPSSEQQAYLSSLGVRLLDYIPDRGFFASVSSPITEADWAVAGVAWMGAIYPEDRLSPRLRAGVVGPWAVNADGTFRLRVKVFADVPVAEFRPRLDPLGIRVVETADEVQEVGVESSWDQLWALAALDEVRWIDEVSPPAEPFLDSVRTNTQAHLMAAAPYALTGRGVAVGVWDIGLVDTNHADFGGRALIGETPGGEGIRPHATHVAGIVGGSGLLSAASGVSERQWRGVAAEAGLVSFDTLDSIPEHRDAYERFGVVISQNSWGIGISDFFGNCDLFGDYSHLAPDYDGVVAGGVLDPPMTVVFAAGNARKFETHGCRIGSYGLISPPGSAKNVLTVGAIYSDTSAMTSFSSWGPTDDGRLKPELVAPGAELGADGGVTSTLPGGKYGVMQGTSMAAPAVSGAAALLIGDYRERFNGQNPLPSTLKALLVHTATDLNDSTDWFSEGPDYASGYGRMQIKEAVDQLRSGGILVGQVGAGATNAYKLTVPEGTGSLKVTLAWDDRPGVENAAVALVNDLDLVVIDPTGSRHFPWTLNPAEPARPATRDREDRLNVVEQVFVSDTVPAGDWAVMVVGHNVPAGPLQKYALAFTPGTAEAPAILVLGGVVSDDAVAGSGDGYLDPGETIFTSIPLRQTDGPSARGISARLVAETAGVKVLQGVSDYPDIQPGETVTNLTSFTYRLAKDFPCGNEFILRHEATFADGFGYTNWIVQQVGRFAVTNVVSGTFEMPDAPMAIPDPGTARSALRVAASGTATAVAVEVRLDHLWMADLGLWLEGPDGTRVRLVSDDVLLGLGLGTGECGVDAVRTRFADDATRSIRKGTVPYVDTFRPEEPLAAFQGRSIAGDWTLVVTDTLSEDSGTLSCWALELDYEQAGFVCSVFNRPPEALVVTNAVVFDSWLKVALPGGDPDEDPVQFEIVSGPARGTVSGFDPAAGTLIYAPPPGYVGRDELHFKVRDGLAESAIGAVVLEVSAARAELALSVMAPEQTVLGELFTNRISVINAGPNYATAVAVTNRLGRGSEFVMLRRTGGDVLDPLVLPADGEASQQVVWEIGTIPTGITISAELILRSLDVGRVTNEVQVAGAEPDSQVEDNVARFEVMANRVADLSVAQLPLPGPALLGQDLVVMVALTNAGPDTATGIQWEADLPEGLALVALDGAEFAASPDGRIVAVVSDLEAGGSMNLGLSLRLDRVGTFEIPTQVSAFEFDFTPEDNAAIIGLEVLPSADLEVTVTTSKSPAPRGYELTYSLSVVNRGPGDATGVRLTNSLPAGVEWVRLQPEGFLIGREGDQVVAELGALGLGEGVILELTVVPPTPGPITNRVAVSAAGQADPDLNNNTMETVTIVEPAVDLAVSLTPDLSPLPVDRLVGWTLSVTNLGLQTATGVVLTNLIPEGAVFGGAGSSQGEVRRANRQITVDLGELAMGRSATVRTYWKVASLGLVTNEVAVGAAELEVTPEDNWAAREIAVRPEADLALIVQGLPSALVLGDETEWRVVVTNRGPALASDSQLAIQLPSGLALQSISIPASPLDPNSGEVRVPLGAPAPGAATEVVIRLLATATGEAGFSLSATTSDADPDRANSRLLRTITIHPRVDLSVSAALPEAPVYFGRELLLSSTVTNSGPHTADRLTVTSLAPAGLELLSATASAGSVKWSGSTADFEVANLPAGETVDLSVTVRSAALGSLTNVWIVTSPAVEPVLTNNRDEQIVEVLPHADLELTASPLPDPAVQDVEFTWHLAVTNRGPNAAEGAEVDGVLPAGLELLALTAEVGSVTTNDSGFRVDLPALPSGSGTTVSLRFKAQRVQSFALAASCSSALADLVPANNRVEAIGRSQAHAGLGLALVVPDDAITVTNHAGDPLDLGLVITNAGPHSASAVSVLTRLPDGVELVSTDLPHGSVTDSDGVLRLAFGSLESGAQMAVEVVLRSTVAGAFTNRFLLEADVFDDLAEDDADEFVLVSLPSANLVVECEVPASEMALGHPAVVKTLITNREWSPASNVIVTVAIPAGVPRSGAEATAGVIEETATGMRWTLDSLAPGASAELNWTLSPIDLGSILLTVSAIADEYDPDLTDNTASAEILVRRDADLVIEVLPASTNLTRSGEWVQHLTAMNRGPNSAGHVVLSSSLPAGFTVLEASADVGVVRVTPDAVECEIDVLAVDAMVTMIVRLAPDQVGRFTSSAAVRGDDLDVVPENNSAIAEVRVLPRAELSLSRLGEPPVLLQAAVGHLRLAITNAGPEAAGIIAIATELAQGLEFVSGEIEGGLVTNLGPRVEAQLPSLAVGGVATLILEVRAHELGAFTNEFVLIPEAFEDDLLDNRVQVTVIVHPAADLTVRVEAPAEFLLGVEAPIELVVTNQGPSFAADVRVTNSLSASVAMGAILVSQGTSRVEDGQLVWELGELAAGGEARLTLPLIPSEQGVYTNWTTVTATEADPVPEDNFLEWELTVLPSADVAVRATANPAIVPAGGEFEYELVLTNRGPNDASSVLLTNQIPAGLALVELGATEGEANERYGLLIWYLERLPAGGVAQLRARFRASELGAFHFVATASAVEGDPFLADNTAVVDVAAREQTDVSVTLSGPEDVLLVGQIADYQVVVVNHGPEVAQEVEVISELPSGLSPLGGISGQGSWHQESGVIVWRAGTLPVGSVATMVFSVTVQAEGQWTNRVRVGGQFFDPVPANNTAEVANKAFLQARLQVGVSASSQLAMLNDKLTYTVVVTNVGTSDAPAVSVLAAFSDLMEIIDAWADRGRVSGAWSGIMTDVGLLAPGEGTAIYIEGRPRQLGELVCQVTAYSPAADPVDPNLGVRLAFPVVNSPTMSFDQSGTRLTLRWPAVATDFLLESTDSLTNPVWTEVQSAPVIDGDIATVTIKFAGPSRFFRMRKL